jgi:hypothetical protein
MRRWRRNADRKLREGISAFFRGGYAELDGETLAQIRDTANEALWQGFHVPLPGGPVAPTGFMWVELLEARDVLDTGPGDAVEAELLGGAKIDSVFGEPDEWGLVGPWRDVYLEIDRDPMGMWGPGLYYRAWGLVPRDPNLPRAPEGEATHELMRDD